MGSPQPRANDLGILYSANGQGTGTYTDIAGVTQANGLLTGAYTEQVTVPLGLPDYSHPWVGDRGAISMFADVVLDTADDVRMKLQGRYDTTTAWTDIQLVREDSGAIAAEQVFVASGTYLIQTASILAVPQIRVVARGGNGLDDGESIVVKAWVQ